MDKLSLPPRIVWNYRTADWSGLIEDLSQCDFRFILVDDTSVATDKFTDILLSTAKKYISQRTLDDEVWSHPWLSERARSAVRKKYDAFNTDRYREECESCSKILREEFNTYVLQVKERLSKLPRGSKQYWHLSKVLSSGKEKKSSVPPLLKDKTWARSPQEKAQLLSECFRDKWTLPPEKVNFYSHMDRTPPALPVQSLQFRSRHAYFNLSTLDPTSATGPDGVSTILLRMVAAAIAQAFAMLARRIVETSVWPLLWKIHRIYPLFKKGSKSSPYNYRGLQITSQLSKAMERFIGVYFLGRLSSTSFGSSQFAYRKYHGSRDAILYALLTWLYAFATGHKVGVYCSDVAGAFDRVSFARLMKKLQYSNLDKRILAVIADWLQGRVGKVTLQGASSDEFCMDNMTFQGTVWGASLWNTYFSDSTLATRRCGFVEIVFADDLNAFRKFRNNIDNATILAQLTRCQKELHDWGSANMVTFESSKESFHILSHTDFHGSTFKLLGVTFDSQLIMSTAVQECATEGHWRLSSLLHCRRFFAIQDLILQYKSQVLSFLEYRTCAVSHAADSHLNILDAVQRRLLRNLNLTVFDALNTFNLAPLSCRRDIANLGIIYRSITNRGPLQLRKIFRLDTSTRRTSPRWCSHRFQTRDDTSFLHRDYINRSTYGYVRIFNLLREDVLDVGDYDGPIPVVNFQRNLTQLLKLASHETERWEEIFSPRYALLGHVLKDFRSVASVHLNNVAA